MTPIETLTASGTIHWGVMLAQGWKGELAGTAQPDSWNVARGWAQRAEQLGFHGIWVFDHFQSYPARDESPLLEAWTTLAALSQATKRLVLGTLVSCAGYRSPIITMKMAENLQILSAGRFCLGLGAGWDQPEYELLGLPFPAPFERANRLEAALHTCRAAWDRAATGLASSGLAADPSRPVLLVGGEGEKRTLPTAVAHADIVNWQVGVEEFSRKSRVLADLCESAGRDPASLRRTHSTNFQLFDSDREFARWRQDAKRGRSAAEVDAYIRNRGALYGTAPEIEETIECFTDAACGGFMIFCNSAPAPHGLEQLATLTRVQQAICPTVGRRTV